MSAPALFDLACEALEQATNLDRLSARGTIRLALKSAGLEPATLTSKQLAVVIERVLPDELKSRGVADPAGTCAALARAIAAAPAPSGPAASTPEDMFRRVRGG